MHRHSTMSIATAEALQAQLQADGFRPGCPRHVTERTQAIDRHICRRLKCPRCKRRSGTWRPFSDGHAYRAISVCGHCFAAQEL